MAGNTIESGRSVSSKLASILIAFADANERSLAEITHLTGLPISTAHRLLGELVQHRMLERGHQGGYRVGLSLRLLRTTGLEDGPTDDRAATAMNDLCEATGNRTRLGVLIRDKVAYTEKTSERDAVTGFASNATLSACSSALGRVLLAFSPPAKAERLIEQALFGMGPPLPTTPAKFRRILTATRMTQAAVNPCNGASEHYCLAMPVFGTGGEVVAALALIVRDRYEMRPSMAALSVASRSLSRDLAATPPVHCLGPASTAPMAESPAAGQ